MGDHSTLQMVQRLSEIATKRTLTTEGVLNKPKDSLGA
jgi:hypothetical protein